MWKKKETDNYTSVHFVDTDVIYHCAKRQNMKHEVQIPKLFAITEEVNDVTKLSQSGNESDGCEFFSS